MKRKQLDRLQTLIIEASREFSLIRDIILQAPQVAASHRNSMATMFTKAECKLVAANNCIIKGGSV